MSNKSGEVGDIHSKQQYDYVLKQALSGIPKTDQYHRPVTKGGVPIARARPLDDRGQAHRARRDEKGKVVEPGGGPADPPPTQNDSMKMIMKFHNRGGTREILPKMSNTKNAMRKDLEHAKMRRDKIVRPAIRPPGTSEFQRQQMQKIRGVQESISYLSKSTNKDFYQALNDALGA